MYNKNNIYNEKQKNQYDYMLFNSQECSDNELYFEQLEQGVKKYKIKGGKENENIF